MEALSVGDVIFVHFPFSDLKKSKLRPAVLVANIQNEDWILCQITSKPYADVNSIEINKINFKKGSLNITSYIRAGKIFTAHISIINKKVGQLNLATRKLLSNNIIELVNIQ